uniref:Gastrin-releasing peptide n=1 Tax=Oryctolagus cuniculus TaxID=9986 RepID=G1SWS1_RABIT
MRSRGALASPSGAGAVPGAPGQRPVVSGREHLCWPRMYRRGNHWAVGHLMGKKSTGESPYASERDSLKQQLREYIRWEEAARSLLGLMEGKGNRNQQPHRLELLGNLQPTWDSEDSSNFRDIGSKRQESW